MLGQYLFRPTNRALRYRYDLSLDPVYPVSVGSHVTPYDQNVRGVGMVIAVNA
jgi:hypothetical protein